ncbi:TfoX/Sxy family DNA transformation protein [Roseinatronobacter monicus]|uniref:TfoX-like protein n=1 Tax=Roseinatronobacter monicus TaxID=393481 RepID=A0A543KDC7_9RHOB|nr:TfoX/Sxy family DNA transformation protein [Roseinatronobacter monicus]TQM93083.1 TfoX-like protein [Roseinatronobacter monicus]
MSTPISSIRNLGPAMEDACARAGIACAEDLRALGTDVAYAKLLNSGHKPHFIAYYVLEMALQGRPWNDCRGEEKARLRARFDTLKAAHTPKSNVMDAFLDEMGVIPANREAHSP